MSAAMGFVGGFLGGFGDGVADKKDREAREAEAQRQDRALASYQQNPGMGAGYQTQGQGSGGMGAGMRGGMGAAGPQGGPVGADLYGLLDSTEGGGRWDTLYGHSQNGGRFDGVDVSKMTLDELAAFSAPSGEYGQWVAANNNGVTATPMGRGQIVGTTMRATAKAMGLPGNTVFSPEVQKSMIGYLADQRISGASSPAAARAGLRAEWAGFKNVSDAALDAAIAKYQDEGKPLPIFAMRAPRGPM